MNKAITINGAGRVRHFSPSLERGNEQTRKFANASSNDVGCGGVSIVISGNVTKEAKMTAIHIIQEMLNEEVASA